MTDYVTDLTASSTTQTLFGESGDGSNKIVFVSGGATLLVDTETKLDAIIVGRNLAGVKSAGTLAFQSPYKIKFKDLNPLTIDPRIVWATDGVRDNGAAGLTVYDLSGFGNNGTKGSTTAVTEGWVLNGTTSAVITVLSSKELSYPKFSFAASCNFTNFTVARTIARKLLSTNGWGITIGTTGILTVQVIKNSVSRTFASLTPISAGAVTHVGVTYDGFVGKVYLNGVLDRTTIFASSHPIGKNAANLTISFNDTSAFLGTIKDVYIFNDAITDSEMLAYANLTEKPPHFWGYLQTELGNTQISTTESASFSIDSDDFPGFLSQSSGVPRARYDFQIMGTGWTADHYILDGHNMGAYLQTPDSGKLEHFGNVHHSQDVLLIDDTGADKPLTTMIVRRGNVSRIKKTGYAPRTIKIVYRIDTSQPGGLTQLARIQRLGSTTYTENNIFNVVTGKHVINSMQLSDYDERALGSAPWKVVDVELEFIRRVL